MNCRFDERANGYSRGEGICVMLMKSLEDAIADGDTIRAVIRGSGTNQDGTSLFSVLMFQYPLIIFIQARRLVSSSQAQRLKPT